MATRVAEMVQELETRADELRPLAAELREVEAALAALKGIELADGGETASQSVASAATTVRRRARKRSDNGAASAPRRSPARSGSTRPAADRAPRGQRREQVLHAVREEPGISARDVAERIGVATNQVHGIVTRLLKDGALARESGHLRPASESTPEHAPEGTADSTSAQ